MKTESGDLLPFTTIYVKQTGSGTIANENGSYEIALPPGTYDIAYQFVGYKTEVKRVEITSGFQTVDVILQPQATLLDTVEINSGDEDPAYTIMRKAIAKAKYHTQEIDKYSARVYIKGAGQLKDYPWLAKKAIKKAGIEKGQVFLTESISDIKYTRPAKFEEKVISIRSDGKDNNTNPNQYIFGSFYEPEIAETISPLSPKAFSYYKFEYMGTFTDRNYSISRIKVIPRSKGDNVIEGMIFLVEDWWSIHSMDINTTKFGVKVNIKAVYAPIEEKVWMPVSHRFKAEGKIFGFEFEYNYMATVSQYKIETNPKVYVEPDKMEVIDEKIEKKQAQQIQEKQAATPKKTKKQEETAKLQERLNSGKEITRKELNTMMKEYEKEEQKQQKEPEVISNTSFKIDSMAYKKDSAYWAEMRPVPLTKIEMRGYQKIDSMAVVEKKKEEGDTLKRSKHKGFQPWDLLIGDTYKISEHSNFKIHFPVPGFNTVEGWNFVYKVTFGTVLQDSNKTRIRITPAFRYAFSREVASGYLNFSLRNKNDRLDIQGGRYIKQYNPDEPILPIINDFTTLLLEKNLMKIYERDYVDLNYRHQLNAYVSIGTSWTWMRRRELFNTTDYKWADWDKIEGYTPNAPVNDELIDTSFPENNAFVGSINVTARPWVKYTIRNGHRAIINSSSPTFMVDYRKGFNNIFGSVVKFDQMEVGVKHRQKVGGRGHADIYLRAGMFFNTEKLYFMDYKHFLGNETPFITNDPVGSFRLLDYYRYSTSDKYFAGNFHYQFRKFLITNIPVVRLMGIHENVFLNYLATPTSQNYTEVGYSIDGILRIFRLEGAAAFQDGKYVNYGFRIGITTNFADFSDN
ncbi:MAG TPA: DUF5686 and carboxypeptidase regulatory-like domain-containing protein [Chryseolinea sp.]|nr:DUF5686 and carboxypeptidase regulatory-like domain-containing protein [Chryseolinea sp.]